MLLPLHAGAVSTRVSNALGAARPAAAKLSVYVTAAFTLVSSGGCCLVAMLLRRQLVAAFSDDQAIEALVVATMPIFAASLLGDGINAACSGVICGVGRQVASIVDGSEAYSQRCQYQRRAY